jgi:hypothetical protein
MGSEMSFKGFKIAEDQSNAAALPTQMVYTYTWEFSKLLDLEMEEVDIKDITLPAVAFDTDTIKTGHATYEFAKCVKWDDCKLTFYDTSETALGLLALAEKVWNKDQGLAVADDYMDESEIKIYNYDGELAYQCTLKNSWIKAVSFSSLTYESSGMNNIIVTLAYTWAEWTQGSSGKSAYNKPIFTQSYRRPRSSAESSGNTKSGLENLGYQSGSNRSPQSGSNSSDTSTARNWGSGGSGGGGGGGF